MGYPQAVLKASYGYASQTTTRLSTVESQEGNVVRLRSGLQDNVPSSPRTSAPARYYSPPGEVGYRPHPGRAMWGRSGPIYRLPMHYVQEAAGRRFIAGALGFLGRANPYVAAFSLGFTLYELWQQYQRTTDQVELLGRTEEYDVSGWQVLCYIGPGTLIGNLHTCSPTTWWTATNAAFANYIANPIVDVGSAYATCRAANIRPHPLAPTTHTQWNSYAHYLKNKPYDLTQDEPGPIFHDKPIAPFSAPWDAFSLPISAPGPEPFKMPWPLAPYRTANPTRSPNEQTWRGPRPRPRPRFTYPPALDDIPIFARSVPGLPGDTLITRAQRPRPGRKQQTGRVVRPGRFQKRKPPGARTKERKFVLSKGNIVVRLIGKTTELAELFEELYKAIPWEIRKNLRPKTRFDKAKAVYRHFLDIDIPRAVENLIKNEIEDRFYGGFGKLAGRGKRAGFNSGYDPSHKGPQTGGRYRPRGPQTDGSYEFPELRDYYEPPEYSVRDALTSAGWI